jgi:hypothetical protein
MGKDIRDSLLCGYRTAHWKLVGTHVPDWYYAQGALRGAFPPRMLARWPVPHFALTKAVTMTCC